MSVGTEPQIPSASASPEEALRKLKQAEFARRSMELRENVRGFINKYDGWARDGHNAGKDSLYGDAITAGYAWEAITDYALFANGMLENKVETTDIQRLAQDHYKSPGTTLDRPLPYELERYAGTAFTGVHVGNRMVLWSNSDRVVPVRVTIHESSKRSSVDYPQISDQHSAITSFRSNDPEKARLPTPEEEQTFVEGLIAKMEAEKQKRIAGSVVTEAATALKDSNLKHSIESAYIPARSEELVVEKAVPLLLERLQANDQYRASQKIDQDLATWRGEAAAQEPYQIGMQTLTLRETATRARETAACLELAKEGPVLAVSTFRAGGSTLLHAMAKTAEHPAQAVVVDSGDDRFLRAGKLKALIAGLDPAEAKKEMTDVDAIQTWDRLLGLHGKYGVFASTEAAVGGVYDKDTGREFFDLLATLKHVRVVIHQQFTADRSQVTNDLFKGFREYSVPPLSLEDTVQALREQLGESGVSFEAQKAKEMVTMLHHFTGGRVIELGCVIAKLSELQKRECSSDDLTKIFQTMSTDVQEAFAGRIFNGPNPVEHLFQFLYQRMTQYLDGDDLRTLQQLAADQPVSDSPSLQRLVKLGFASTDRSTGRPVVNGTLMKTVIPAIMGRGL